jgi:hypothetical protein
MTARITASADDTPGHARITITGAARTPEVPIRIRRDGWDTGILGPQGWQAGDTLLRPAICRAEGRDLVMVMGPEVTRHLDRGVYLMSVPGAAVEEEAVIWPDIQASFGGSRMRTVPASTIPVADKTLVVDDRGGSKDKGKDKGGNRGGGDKPPPPRRWAWLAGAVALILILIGSAALYFTWHHPPPLKTHVLTKPSQPSPPPVNPPVKPPVKPLVQQPAQKPTQQPAPVPAPVPVPPPPPPPAPRSLSGLSYNDVIAQTPNADAIFEEGERRFNGTRKDDGLLLIEAAADKGDPKAMLALARLYDPVTFDPKGPIPQPDIRESAENYRKAVEAGLSDAIAPRAALHAYLENKAQQGDLDAKFALQDFWP